MKQLIFVMLLVGLYQQRDWLDDVINGAPDPGPAVSGEVVLLATSWCGYCAKARKFFAENGIEYTEFDVEESAEGQARFDALGGGGIPVVLIGDQVIRGYNASVYKRLLL